VKLSFDFSTVRRYVCLLGLTLLVFASCSIANAQQRENRVALVIGNSAYKQAPLRNPANDARDMAAKLRSLGFTVIERNNLGIKQIGSTLREFRSKLTPGSVALVYYAGHGLQIKGENYLPAVDAEISGEEDVPNQSLAMRQIMDVLGDAKTRLNLVFLDACRDNPYARSFRSAARGLSKENAPSGTLISFATRPGSVAADGVGRNGLYTGALLAAMNDASRPIEQVLKTVVTSVRAQSGNQQEPWMEGSIEGEFCFGKCSDLQQVTVSDDRALWEAVKDSRDVNDFRAYIEKFPRGLFSEVAGNRIRSLTQNQNLAGPSPPSAGTGPASVKSEPLKIAFVYVGPASDGGWNFAHDNGRKAVEKEFGDRVKITRVERVPESADAERNFRALVAQGNRLIFGTTFGYMEPMLKVAANHKDVRFEHATGYKKADNLRTYDSRTYEGAYMAGVIAGKMTKTNVLGVVGSIPIPETIRNINSFTLGAQSVNPKIKTKVAWVGEWFNPPEEADAATALINGGADVLMQNTDSSAVLQTAEKMGKRAFGWDSDMTNYGPKAHLGSAIINWAPYYIKATRDALEGKWSGNSGIWWGVKEGSVDLVSIASDVPEDARRKLNEVKAGLRAGTFAIWRGPIVTQDGQTVVAQGAVADDIFKSEIMFYVRGVEGRIPGLEKKK
jgi:basic membrane protein A